MKRGRQIRPASVYIRTSDSVMSRTMETSASMSIIRRRLRKVCTRCRGSRCTPTQFPLTNILQVDGSAMTLGKMSVRFSVENSSRNSITGTCDVPVVM